MVEATRSHHISLHWLNRALWLVYLGSYPIAVIGVAFDVRPGFSMAWAGSVLLFVQGALAVLWWLRALGWRRGGALALAIALGGYSGETVGVTTGFPFGPYRYANILFPQLPGSVPLPVICAWLLVVTTAVAGARWLVPMSAHDPRTTRWLQVGVATLLGVGLDLVLDPVAVQVQHYWIWQTTGRYYGIPLTNFLGWAALCALLTGLVILGGPASPQRQAEAAPSLIWLYLLTVLMFGIVDLTHGLLIAAFVSVLLMMWLALHWRATYHIA